MGLITITRLLGSGGDYIATELCERLGYVLVDKDVVSREIEDRGLDRLHFEKIDERKPSLMDRFFNEQQHVYLHLIQTIFYEYAQKGNAVFLGRGGQVILRDLPNALHVRIKDERALRIKRLVDDKNIDEHMAHEMIKQADADRVGYLKHLFGVDRFDPDLYDLVIDTGKIGLDLSVEIIAQTIDSPHFKTHDEEAKLVLQSMILAKRVEDELINNPRVDSTHINIEALADGSVILKGIVYTEKEKEDAASIVSETDGVASVDNQLVVAMYPTSHLGF